MTLIQHLENHFGTFIPEGGMYEITNAIYNLAKQVGANDEEIKAAIQIAAEIQRFSTLLYGSVKSIL